MDCLNLNISVLYNSIFTSEKKKLAVLIDPDKQDDKEIAVLSEIIQESGADLIFVGGSLISKNFDQSIEIIKKHTDLPVVLFPGSHIQISEKADALLFLSMISGRNPDLLIGSHVVAAPFLKNSSLEIISTGYILIDGNRMTSVEYMSNTKPIPADKIDIITATAIAGEMIGHKLIYLEAGSGAKNHVSKNVIIEVKKNIKVPVIVGGGISTIDSVKEVCDAGADIIVIGNAFEKRSDLVRSFADIIHGMP